MSIRKMAERAKGASIELAACSSSVKDSALESIAQNLQKRSREIIDANRKDLERSREENLSPPLMKRLRFDQHKLNSVIKGIESLVRLEDPVGRTLDATELDKGLELYRVSCPIGVTGVIFESRPDALVQISMLCLKSGNAVLLKGGSEARETNRVLADAITEATDNAGIPAGWLVLLETREDAGAMLKLDDCIDLLIPRGSKDFVRHIMDNSSIPVLGHADGICHLFVDRCADTDMAVRIATDSKTQYAAVCNALETLLVHADIAKEFLPELKKGMEREDVELRGCGRTLEIIEAERATDDDWSKEYLDRILSVKVVRDINEAIAHINRYGSGHTDAIVTEDRANAEKFMDLVDSGNVFWNCSTRFSDGYRYGLGAEVGISTNKIHARGPVGLEGLLIYKYKLMGSGQTVAEYENGKKFTHRSIDKNRL